MDITQNRGTGVRSDLFGGLLHGQRGGGRSESVVWSRNPAKILVQGLSNPLNTEHVVSIGPNLDFQLRSFVGPLDVFGGVLVKLDSELETELVELLGGVFLAQQGEQVGLIDSDGRHG
ncbi:hypothetical protein OGAPHI_003388 [Ogataea philodendri]|uniref:Uncharacterized protein n=1 Tax=Ogataea philodendri TaxID=1378263 RepID=A0A9P8P6X8_9ASCO|nr:uncharacterized protein OGAPHI_003388 [Ogataea philodendri]KAH3666938.1 hypothetical protein OGAPHI_003388 [Ogataea philodendri]